MFGLKESLKKKRAQMLQHLKEDEQWVADAAYEAAGGLGKCPLCAMLFCC